MKKYQTIITVDELKDCATDPQIVIIDCRFYLDDIYRGRKEYLQAHIPNAVYLDIGQDLSSPVIKGITGRHPLPHPEVLAGSLRNAGVGQDSQIIAYDQSNGAYAARLWWLMRWLGHDDVAVLNGGFKEWKNANGSIDNQWTLSKPGNFSIDLRNDLIINRESIHSSQHRIIDSREYKRFTGEYEPIDPVAGHIEGAICIPYMENTNGDGIWKDPNSLGERFSNISDNRTVFYCGSGVTACHNILAYKIATGNDALLYPGSWSEWINYHPAVVGN